MKKIEFTDTDLTAKAYDTYSNSSYHVFLQNHKYSIYTTHKPCNGTLVCKNMSIDDINDYFEGCY